MSYHDKIFRKKKKNSGFRIAPLPDFPQTLPGFHEKAFFFEKPLDFSRDRRYILHRVTRETEIPGLRCGFAGPELIKFE